MLIATGQLVPVAHKLRSTKTMDKTKLQPLKGFRDFLPKEARKRAWLKNKLIEITERWGYEPLETPTLEPLELFEGQIGEDEKLFYKFKDYGGRGVALRYDQTVPTCRFVVQYKDKITFPFKRYQCQTVFRAEKPQAGRYREFLQFDFDILGVESEFADAECVALTIDIYLKLGFKDVIVTINDRDLLKSIPYPAIVAIDKLEKIGEENVIKEIQSKNISLEDSRKYLDLVKNLKPNERLSNIFTYLKNAGFDQKNFKFEPLLARSFSYSTGPIWEVKIPGFTKGSVGGGERYDEIVEKISGQKIPGTGIALGFDRTLEALEELKLLPKLSPASEVLVTVFSPELESTSLTRSLSLRANGINTELYPDPNVKLDKQLRYADKKGIPFALIIGPEEVKNNTVTIKDMKSTNQETVETHGLTNWLNGKLNR